MTEEGFWGALRAAGITPRRRCSDRQFLGQNRSNDVFPINDPVCLTPEMRKAEAERIIAVNGDTTH